MKFRICSCCGYSVPKADIPVECGRCGFTPKVKENLRNWALIPPEGPPIIIEDTEDGILTLALDLEDEYETSFQIEEL